MRRIWTVQRAATLENLPAPEGSNKAGAFLDVTTKDRKQVAAISNASCREETSGLDLERNTADKRAKASNSGEMPLDSARNDIKNCYDLCCLVRARQVSKWLGLVRRVVSRRLGQKE